MDEISVPESLKTRLKESIGDLVSAIKKPSYFGIYPLPRPDINILTSPEKASTIYLGDFVLLFDYLRKEIIACRIVGENTYDADNTDFTDHVHTYNDQKETAFQVVAAGRIDSLNTPHIFSLEPVVKLDLSGNIIKSFLVDFTPSIPTSAFLPTLQEVKTIFDLTKENEWALKLGMYITQDRIYQTHEGEYLPIGITPDILRTHMSIIGQSGTGKTQILKSIILQLQQKDYALLVTDSQGDIVSMLWRNEFADNQEDFINAQQDFKLWGNYGWSKDNIGIEKSNIIVFYPPILDPNTDPFLYDVQQNGVTTKCLRINSSTISEPEELAVALRGLSDPQFEALHILFNMYNDENDFTLMDFISYIASIIGRNDLPQGIQPATANVLTRKLRVLAEKGILDTETSTETKYRDFMQKGKITVLYMPSESISSEIQALVELLVFKIITKQKVDSEVKYRAIIIDEAQDLIPKRSSGNAITQALVKSFEKLAFQGRKYWISLIIASQKPNNIHPTVFSQCSNRIFLRVSNLELEDVKAYIPSQFLSSIVKYKTLMGVFVTPGKESMEIKFPVPPIFHTDPMDIVKLYKNLLPDIDDSDSSKEKSMTGTFNTETDISEEDDWEG